MYAGAGSADITNWCRAALVIDPTHDPRTFKFIAAKRARRIGWVDPETGERPTVQYFCHANGDEIYWTPATEEDMARFENAKPVTGTTKKAVICEDILALVPNTGMLPKNALLAKAHTAKIGSNLARGLISQLVAENRLFEHLVPRSRTCPEVHLSRHEQRLI